MLENEHIEGLVVDLRYNGGGSLIEAIALAGLFIPHGPMVQVRVGDNSKQEYDQDGGFAYDIPLVIMTNRGSASASEIMAAAIQDYGRGVVVGDEMTHGKGTVQTVIQLDKQYRALARLKPKPGALKYTNAKFYRVNGGSTQRKGVTPDIIMPSFLDHLMTGESDLEHALPWDVIQPANYRPVRNAVTPLLPELIARHSKRMGDDSMYQQLLEDIHEFGKRRKRKEVPLLWEKREALRQEDEDWAKKSEESLATTKRSRYAENEDYSVETDIYMGEALSVLSDLISIQAGADAIAHEAVEDGDMTE